MAAAKHVFTTPVGRLVGGSLYKGKTHNDKGERLLYKNGAKKGQERADYSIGVAFPKTPGAQHWAQEVGTIRVQGVLQQVAWLAPVLALGRAAFPGGHAERRDFSWKIIDGDSTEPNKNMKRPCDQEGYPGHWVIWFSGTSAPRVYDANGTALITEEGAVKPGYFVQVCGDVTDNSPSETPGMYWNASMVAFAGHGAEIVFGPDVASAGFGGTPLPPGASAMPLPGNAVPLALPGAAAAPLGLPPAAPAAPIQPLGAPPAPNSLSASLPVPGGVSLASAPSARVMTPAAQGTYEQYMATPGCTDALLIQNGLMYPPAAPAGLALPLPGGSALPLPGAAPIAVVPNPAFLQVPGASAAALGLPPPMALPVAVPQPTPAAGGRTREQLLAMPGWTEALLLQHGMLQ